MFGLLCIWTFSSRLFEIRHVIKVRKVEILKSLCPSLAGKATMMMIGPPSHSPHLLIAKSEAGAGRRCHRTTPSCCSNQSRHMTKRESAIYFHSLNNYHICLTPAESRSPCCSPHCWRCSGLCTCPCSRTERHESSSSPAPGCNGQHHLEEKRADRVRAQAGNVHQQHSPFLNYKLIFLRNADHDIFSSTKCVLVVHNNINI